MATRHQILCIKKSDRTNPHERITQIGFKNSYGSISRISQVEAINAIERNEMTFYVDRGGSSVNVIVSTSRLGNKYLKTTNDGEQPDNLLSLPECQ